MTALDKFIRLEAVGHWHENAHAEPVEVIVSFGDATLQLTSLADAPITHWSLLATRRIGTKGSAVIYSADTNGDETLTIDDPDMTRAITAVTNEIGETAPKKRRLRKYIWLGLVLILVGLLSQSRPLIYEWAAKLTSPARKAEIANALHAQMESFDLFICQDIRAKRALTAFSQSLFPENPPKLNVIITKGPNSSFLPDGQIYLSGTQIETAENAASLAAIIAVQWAMYERQALLIHIFENTSPNVVILHIFGKNAAPTLPMSFPKPIGEDFIAARDHLQNQNIDTRPLQEIATRYGFGLPINGSAITEDFAAEPFAELQLYCAN